jgi:hypothetical protein
MAWPEPLRSYLRSDEAGVPLYAGPAVLLVRSGQRVGLEVVVTLQWLPSPRLTVVAALEHPQLLNLDFDENLVVDLPVGLGRSSGSPVELLGRLTSISEGHIEFVLIGPVVLQDAHAIPASWASVHVVNLLDFWGREVTREKLAGSTEHASRRFTVDTESWTLVLDPVRDVQAALRTAMLRAGYAITHTARPTTKQRPLYAHEVADVLNEIGEAFSLITGSTVGLCLADGYDEDDRQIWSTWSAPDLYPYEGHLGPLPRWLRLPDAAPITPDLSALTNSWLQRHAEPDLAVILERLGTWYRSALHSTGASSSMFAGAGLELATYWQLVHVLRLSMVGFDRLPAADRLRLTLTSWDVDLAVPEHLSALADLARQQRKRGQEGDGPWAVMTLRNATVHPPSKQGHQAFREDRVAEEAAHLAVGYLDLAILRFLDYQGPYRDRLSPKWPTSLVPWSALSEQPLVSEPL